MKQSAKPNELIPSRPDAMSTQPSMPGRRRINVPTTIVLALFHVGAVAALFAFTWAALAEALFLTWLAGGLGISMGYHRLHTHRSYRVPLILEYFFALRGTLSRIGARKPAARRGA
jgi:fatty-acid desaturase